MTTLLRNCRPGRALGWVAVPVALWASTALAGGTESPRLVKICGARCVEFVEHWYGKRADIIAIIRDLHGDRVDKPLSFQEVSAYLARDGIHTAGYQVPAGSVPTWSYPVILQTSRAAEDDHFVVWIPAGDGHGECYWSDEVGYIRELGPAQGVPTGRVLVTSPTPIGGSEFAVARDARRALTPVLGLVGVLAGGLYLATVICKVRRTAAVPTKPL